MREKRALVKYINELEGLLKEKDALIAELCGLMRTGEFSVDRIDGTILMGDTESK